MWPRVTTCLEGCVTLYVEAPCKWADHSGQFNGYGPRGSRDVTYFISYVTLENHKIKCSFDYKEGSSSLCVTTLSNLVAAVIVVMEI